MNGIGTSPSTQTEPKTLDSDLLGLYCSSLYRKCSNCGRTGHNSRTCLEARADAQNSGDTPRQAKTEEAEAQDKAREDLAGSDVSDHKSKAGGRKKGVAWTEEEHKQFLNGLSKLGKGNWRGISRHFVQSKSPTQVASHAQKYFIRQTVAGKRKRRSSLFDLVPENENAREAEMGSHSAASTQIPVKAERQPERPSGPEPNTPAMPSMQGPEALAWACWYQTMVMQQNPMNWMPPMPGAVQSPNMSGKVDIPPQPQATFPQAQVPGGMQVPPIASGVNPTGPEVINPAMAAYLAQQSQMAAMLALNYMPQLSPEYLARYAAGLQIHSTAAQAAQQAAQSAISSKRTDEKLEAEGSADDNLSALEKGQTRAQDEDDKEPISKFPRRTENASRYDLSNASTETEEFGNGALVKPKAQKVKSWMELPSFLQERKSGGSLLNSTSKQSQSTQFGSMQNPVWTRSPPLEMQTLSSQDPRAANSASNAVEGTVSETPSAVMDPNLATSHYKAQSEMSKFQPSSTARAAEA